MKGGNIMPSKETQPIEDLHKYYAIFLDKRFRKKRSKNNEEKQTEKIRPGVRKRLEIYCGVRRIHETRYDPVHYPARVRCNHCWGSFQGPGNPTSVCTIKVTYVR